MSTLLLPALKRTQGGSPDRSGIGRTQSSVHVKTTQERLMKPAATFFRAHSVEPAVDRDLEVDRTASVDFKRTRSMHRPKAKLTREEVEQIHAASRKAMDAAILPCSQRIVLSIDREEEDETRKVAEDKQRLPGASKNLRRNRLAHVTTPTLSHYEEEVERRKKIPSQHLDGREIRRLASIASDDPDPAPSGLLRGGKSRQWVRHSYPFTNELGIGFLLDLGLKDDVLSPHRRDNPQLERFTPVTARARGTYVYGLHGDIVKSHSLVASLQPPIAEEHETDLSQVEDGELTLDLPGTDRVANNVWERERFGRARTELKTAGGSDWNCLSAEERETRLRDDFGALLVQYKRYIHELVLWNGDWYFKTSERDRDKMCLEIAGVHADFRKVMLELRPILSDERVRPHTLMTKEIHEHILEGLSTFVTNAMLEDARRGDDELKQFEVSEFKFSRRADWVATNALRTSLVTLCEAMVLLKAQLRGGKQKKAWKNIKNRLPMVRTSSAMRVQELSKDSRVACTLRDTLKDSPLDRAVHVSLGPAAVCHHTESKKMQDHLDRSSQDQMDLKVARKIDDIRRAFQSRHLSEATNISSNCFRQLKVVKLSEE